MTTAAEDMLTHRKRHTLSLVLALSFGFGLLTPMQPAPAQDKKVLHGQVREQDYRLPTKDDFGGPSLSRSDIGRLGDPFSGKSDGGASGDLGEALDAPHGAFQAASSIPTAPRKKNFGLQADMDDFAGTSMGGIPDNASAALKPGVPMGDSNIMQGAPQTGMVPPGQNPNVRLGDPMEAGEDVLAWDAWHKRVAAAISQRFTYFARAAFNDGQPNLAVVSYVVSRDGRVDELRFIQKSPNVMFNALVAQVVKSLNGDKALLQFPPTSRRMAVEKTSTFSKDTGKTEGFAYITGDRETIQMRR